MLPSICKLSNEILYILFFILSLQSPVWILHVWHISIKTTHILNAQQSHVAVATKVDSVGLRRIHFKLVTVVTSGKDCV